MMGPSEFESESQAPKARRMDQATLRPLGGGIERPVINSCLSWQGIYRCRVQITCMKKAWVAVAVGVVVAIILMFYLFGGLLLAPQGFQDEDLRAPWVSVTAREEELPGPLGLIDHPVNARTAISYNQNVYEDYGGMAELYVENNGNNDVYVRYYILQWEGGDAYVLNCSMLVEPGEMLGMGPLYFAGPGTTGPSTLNVIVDLWGSSNNGATWSDKGEQQVMTLDFDVLAEEDLREWEVERNPLNYYNKVNELVDFEVVGDMAEEVRDAAPGNYSLMQIIKAYEMVRSEIAYLTDEDNHWQSPSETLELGTGDCEDHAILLASLLTALGGNCRVNLIAGHAFPSVFVGNETEVNMVVEGIQTYYRNEVPVHWTEDEMGYWLVVDTNGMPYPGGYPAAASPTGGPGGENWNFDDGDWIRMIDVTGETVFSLWS